MKDINKIILVGRLGADPTLRHTKNGVAVVQIPVATSRRIFKADASPSNETGNGSGNESINPWAGTHQGGYSEETQWHRVIAWNRQGEACAKHLKKGDKVYVEGFIRSRKYEKEGKTSYIFEIHAEEVSFLSDRPRVEIPRAEMAIPEIGI
jgi:single-strand DNA-binding protein